MLILGIETSCDETSVALVEDGRRVLASHIASQINIHQAFGGVVPELASRAHLECLQPMLVRLLESQKITMNEVDAVAVTLGPGLVGALLIGLESAKALAWVNKKPLIPVHHVAAHLYAPFLRSTNGACCLTMLAAGKGDGVTEKHPEEQVTQAEELTYPYVGLAVSGGHTSLVLAKSPCEFELLAETVDDAAGEAFDKVAKLMELGYPGGPIIDKQASLEGADPTRFDLPRPMLRRDQKNFSFSGLKTAVASLVSDLGGAEALKSDPQLLADVCASFRAAVVDVLLGKARTALKTTGMKQLAICGGVACNAGLRKSAQKLARQYRVFFPQPAFCTDNAAMVAGLAWHLRDRHKGCDLSLNAAASLPLPGTKA